ncbi:hypothetical protein RI367_000491 [Sorochytrium milnesiophthora]
MDFLQTQAQQELLAEQILTDQQSVVDYDRKRQSNREALQQLSRQTRGDTARPRAWINLGDLFIRLDAPVAQKMIEKDQRHLNVEIDRMREGIKEKAKELEVLQGGSTKVASQFDLRPLQSSSSSQ